MRRIVQVVQNTSIIFLLSVIILIVIHKVDMNETVVISSLLNLLVISVATQIISVIMDYITIRPIGIHMLVELIAMELMVLTLGFSFGLLNFDRLSYVLIDILLIALVYILVVLYYYISSRYTAEEINQYLKNKAKSE
jgi:hypothetical protein